MCKCDPREKPKIHCGFSRISERKLKAFVPWEKFPLPKKKKKKSARSHSGGSLWGKKTPKNSSCRRRRTGSSFVRAESIWEQINLRCKFCYFVSWDYLYYDKQLHYTKSFEVKFEVSESTVKSTRYLMLQLLQAESSSVVHVKTR